MTYAEGWERLSVPLLTTLGVFELAVYHFSVATSIWSRTMMNLDRRDFLAGLISLVAVSDLSQGMCATPAFVSAVLVGLASDSHHPLFRFVPAANPQ